MTENIQACRIIAITNQKGGVGKTTTAINVASSLALAGQRVLLVDVDPQSNLTSGVGLKGLRATGGTIYEALLTEAAAETFLLDTQIENLTLIPADRGLTGAEIELVALPERERRLQRVVDRAPRAVRSHLHRLPALARPTHAECAGRGGRGTDSTALRVFRARRPRRSGGHDAPRARCLESLTRHRRASC